jgi:hypothetical protein
MSKPIANFDVSVMPNVMSSVTRYLRIESLPVSPAIAPMPGTDRSIGDCA